MMNEKDIIWSYGDLSEGREIVAEIASMELEESEYSDRSSTQLHLQLKPDGYVPKGPTGHEHEWYSISGRSNSKWGHFLKALKACGIDIPKTCTLNEAKKILVGKTFRWEKKVLTYGTMKVKVEEGKEAKETWIPLELSSASETESSDSFAELDEKLRGGMTETEIFRWGRENRISKSDVTGHIDSLTLTEDDGQLWLD